MHLRVENSAGDVVKLVRFVPCHDSVPGIGTALVTDDQIKLRRQQVDKLSFGFIAPLKTDHTGTRHRKLQKFNSQCHTIHGGANGRA